MLLTTIIISIISIIFKSFTIFFNVKRNAPSKIKPILRIRNRTETSSAKSRCAAQETRRLLMAAAARVVAVVVVGGERGGEERKYGALD